MTGPGTARAAPPEAAAAQESRTSPASRTVGLYLARRITGTLLLLAVMSLLIFSLLYLEPGDIVRNLLGTRPANPQTVAQIRAEYHLNESFVQQYLTWLGNAVTGNFGTSVQSGQPVAAAITSRLALTIELVVFAFCLAVAAGVPAGVLAGVRHGRSTDRAVVGGAVLFVSAPAFALGLLMLYLFADYLNWFPIYGTGNGVAGRLNHLLLPAATLALGLGGFILKITRAAVIREMEQDYVMFARARGLQNRQVLAVVLRNASVPVGTSLGLALAYLVGSTVLVEQVFSLPGLGTLLNNAVIFKDVPVVQALTLLIAAAIALSALLVDLAYLALDPRIRHEMTAAR